MQSARIELARTKVTTTSFHISRAVNKISGMTAVAPTEQGLFQRCFGAHGSWLWLKGRPSEGYQGDV